MIKTELNINRAIKKSNRIEENHDSQFFFATLDKSLGSIHDKVL
jgi:hypothetical protein